MQDFGNALRRLVVKVYSGADAKTQDMLARDYFTMNVDDGEFRIQLRSAKPVDLETAVNLAAELDLLCKFERNSPSSACVRSVEVENEHSVQNTV